MASTRRWSCDTRFQVHLDRDCFGLKKEKKFLKRKNREDVASVVSCLLILLRHPPTPSLIDFLVPSHWGWPSERSDKHNSTEGDRTSGATELVPNFNKNYTPVRRKRVQNVFKLLKRATQEPRSCCITDDATCMKTVPTQRAARPTCECIRARKIQGTVRLHVYVD